MLCDALLLCKLLPLCRLSWLGYRLCPWQGCGGWWQLSNPADVNSLGRKGKKLCNQCLCDFAGNGQAGCVRVCSKRLCIDWAWVEGCQVSQVKVELALKRVSAQCVSTEGYRAVGQQPQTARSTAEGAVVKIKLGLPCLHTQLLCCHLYGFLRSVSHGEAFRDVQST